MTFAEWRNLTPAQSARELLRRVTQRLSPDQQRAVIAALPDEEVLVRRMIDGSRQGSLSGVPFFLKDLFPVAGHAMRAGSTFLPEIAGPAVHDAAIVTALRRNGAVLAGMTHLHEFAYGITGENVHYGDCENPKFPLRLTGGSSSGSAAVVAAGIAPLAVGTDTGGSIRVPAAFCGLYGMRLTPRDPLINDGFPLASSYDTAGWFTANAADMTWVLHALVGIGHPDKKSPRGFYLETGSLDPDVAGACRMASHRLVDSHDTGDDETKAALTAAFARSVETYNTVVAEEAWTVHRTWAEKYRERYDPGVWTRLVRGRDLSPAQRDAAVSETAKIKAAWSQFFANYDFLVMPASPFPAPTKAECTLENRSRILAVTAPASVGGNPVLTIPVALPSGLSTGLQVIVAKPDSTAISWVLAQT